MVLYTNFATCARPQTHTNYASVDKLSIATKTRLAEVANITTAQPIQYPFGMYTQETLLTALLGLSARELTIIVPVSTFLLNPF